jgi:hypothetical protein
VGVKRSNFRRSKQEIETIIDQEIKIIAKFQEIKIIAKFQEAEKALLALRRPG